MVKIAKKINYMCDFETTTDPNDCRVWGYGIFDINELKLIDIGNNINNFMSKILHKPSNIYFHNLKFDGYFILDWLFNNDYSYSTGQEEKTFNVLISSFNAWYSIKIVHSIHGKDKKVRFVTIYDSLKKLPFKVKDLTKAYNLEDLKGEIDYNLYREENHKITDEEFDYIEIDVKNVSIVLNEMFNQGLKKMTIGSDALSNFKNTIGGEKMFRYNFPLIDEELDNKIRGAYKGGFTYLMKTYRYKEIGKGIVFDVNSLYPYVMREMYLPFGNPIYFKGKPTKKDMLYIVNIYCMFELKENKIPTIQLKNSFYRFNETEYLESSDGELVYLQLTNIDYDLFLEHYNVYNLKIEDGFYFDKQKGIFNKYVDQWGKIKESEKGAKKQFAKLMLNSLYGKFATSTDRTGKYPVVEDGVIKLKNIEEKNIVEPTYTPMGVFITSYARDYTIRTAQSCYKRFVYCDTDSIHLTGWDIPKEIEKIIDDKKLGYWKCEGRFIRGKFLRSKRYFEEKIELLDNCIKDKIDITDKEIRLINGRKYVIFKNVVCAGLPSDKQQEVSFKDFEIGYKSSRLQPKAVKGGVVLIETEFNMKG